MQRQGRAIVKVASRLFVLTGAVLLCITTPAELSAAAAPTATSVTPSAATWSQATIPEPVGGFSGKLLGASCASPTDCNAVGWGSTTGSAIGTVVENWNGSTWSTVASPNPDAPGDSFPQLNAVDCDTTTSCTAVGTDLTLSNDSNTVVESYNGVAWSVVPSPDVGDAANNTLNGVACRTSGLCMAVGNSVTNSPDIDTLIEQWNGVSWTIDPSPNVDGALQTTLTSVACPSNNTCMAVGYSLADSGTEPVVEQWNGTTWSLATPAQPPGSADNELTGVDCFSKLNCVAVGRTYATESSASSVLAESWNGTNWSVVSTPNPTGILGDFLVSVSCSSASKCQAAGESYPDDDGDSQTLVEQLSAGTWSLETTPNAPGTTTSLLSGMACPTASSACVAVGQSYTPDDDSLLALADQGGVWGLTTVNGTTTPARSSLSSIGCSTSTCVAVGSAFPANDFDRNGLIEQWDGTDWSLGTSAEPDGAVVTDLNGAACPTPSVCIAVGDVGIGTSGADGQVGAFAESWNGASWSTMVTPDPAGTYISLTSISYTSATACVAVGYSEASPGGSQSAFAEQLSGTTWTLDDVATPAGATATDLQGVSCADTAKCVAVGSYINASSVTQTLAEKWSGRSWSVSPSSDVSGSTTDDLLGVSCAKASECTAVGYSEASGGSESSLAEQLLNGAWSVQVTPDVTNAFDTVMTGVDCVKASSCTASGYAVNGGADTTLIAQSNGAKWKVVTSATINGDEDTGLNGVACTSATFCAAAGSGPDGTGLDDALIEQS